MNSTENAPKRSDLVSNWPSKKQRIFSIGLALLLTPVIAFGALRALEHSGTRIADWLPDSFPETVALRTFARQFGSDELLMISWPDLKAGSEDLNSLREHLLAADSTRQGDVKYFAQVWTADSIRQALADPPLSLSDRQIDSRIRGWMLGSDSQAAAVALVANPATIDRSDAVDFARRVAVSVSGQPIDEIRMAGSTIETVAIDEASKQSLVLLNSGSAVLCFLLILGCVRNVFYSIIIFLISLFFQQCAMALIHYSGGQMDSILLLTANLSGVLSISASIHMFGYYREALAERKNAEQENAIESTGSSPVWNAFRRALLPTSLAALTTSIGFASLALSDVVPIRNFGFYSAIVAPGSVMLTLWFLAMYLRNSDSRHAKAGGPTIDRSVQETSLSRHALLCQRGWLPILIIFAGMLAFGGSGVLRLRTSVGIHDLFPDDARLLNDYRWLEQEIGPLVPIEAVVEVPANTSQALRDQILSIGKIQARLLKIDEVGTAYSALNYCPPELLRKSRGGLGGLLTDRVLKNKQTEIVDVFRSYRLVHDQDGSRFWRISLRVPASTPHDYPELMSRVQRTADAAIADAGNGLSIKVIGGIPLAAKTQQRLLHDLGQSFLMAFVLIAVTIAVVLRSPFAGLATVLPNVVPALTVFGLMGFMGWKAGIGGVMTASVVLGIAVDDSLHFVLAFRASMRAGCDRLVAVSHAILVCRPAIVQTSVVVGVGMLVFVFSPFLPIQWFAILVFCLLAVALAANLVILPAILLSPLGRFFVRKQ